MSALLTALLFPFLAVGKVLAVLLGLLAVAVALPFAREAEAPALTGNDRLVYAGWTYRRLPGWADWLWGNDKYGSLGNWFWPGEGDPKSFWRQYVWLALRNPANNLNRYSLFRFTGSGATRLRGNALVNDVHGVAGWQLVTLGWRAGLYCILPYGSTGRSLRIRLGYKLNPNSSRQDAGLSVLINPFSKFGS